MLIGKSATSSGFLCQRDQCGTIDFWECVEQCYKISLLTLCFELEAGGEGSFAKVICEI